MSATIPVSEPTNLRAGDTWKWRREDLSDYPASTWTLKYRFKNAAGGFEITAAADGDQFAVTEAASTTAAHPAGDYDWIAWVEAAGEKFTVGVGRLTVEPDLRANDADNPLDARSSARIGLEAIEAVLAKRATKDQESYQINGRALNRTPIADLLKLRNHYKLQVMREDEAAAVAKGLGNPRKFFVRFGRA